MVRRNDTNDVVSPDTNYRNTGEMPVGYVNGKGMKKLYIDGPQCAVNKFNLNDEWDKGDVAKSHFAVINADRECGEYVGLNPALSPKEHIEMKILHQVKAEHREWRDEEQRRQDKFEERIIRRHKTTLVFQFLLAIMAAVVALIAAKLLPFF